MTRKKQKRPVAKQPAKKDPQAIILRRVLSDVRNTLSAPDYDTARVALAADTAQK